MNTTTCRDGAPLLMDYLEGALPAGLRAELDAHLAGCRRCVAFVRAYRETPRILRESTAAGIPARAEESLRRFLSRHRNPPSEG